MAILLWWLPPILATVAAVAWMIWSGRRTGGGRWPGGTPGSPLTEPELRRMARVLERGRASPPREETRPDRSPRDGGSP